MLRHICLYQFDETLPESTIKEILAGFGALVQKVPGGRAVTYGRNISPEGLNRGYEHGFVMDFDSAEARDVYLAHPDHVAFAQGTVIPALKEGLDSVVVFAYEVEE